MNKIVLIAMAVLLSSCQAWVQPEPEPVTQEEKKTNWGMEGLKKIRKDIKETEAKFGPSKPLSVHTSDEKKFYLNGKLYYCHVNAYDEYICNE